MNADDRAYFVKGTAKVRLTGWARLIDSSGKVVKERDLSELGEIEIPVRSRTMALFNEELCGVNFNIDNVFHEEE